MKVGAPPPEVFLHDVLLDPSRPHEPRRDFQLLHARVEALVHGADHVVLEAEGLETRAPKLGEIAVVIVRPRHDHDAVHRDGLDQRLRDPRAQSLVPGVVVLVVERGVRVRARGRVELARHVVVRVVVRAPVDALLFIVRRARLRVEARRGVQDAAP
eukprot:28998-Pelagococcus_subviridis.AAC.6